MVFVTIKKVGKNAYAYLYKCTRINGRPKPQYIAYLGVVTHINKSLLKNIKTKADFNKLKRKRS
jgi:hypothetical protein